MPQIRFGNRKCIICRLQRHSIFRRFRNDGCLDVQLGVSRDGISWSRPDRRPYVPLGLKGSWDGACIYMALGMIRKGDEIWQYYYGVDSTHGRKDLRDLEWVGGLGRLVQRLDGFVSADADYTGAEFFTPLITFSGANLELNVDCSALGEVWVEILDENNLLYQATLLKNRSALIATRLLRQCVGKSMIT